MIERIESLPARQIADLAQADCRERARRALEDGRVVHLPHLGFTLLENERAWVDPANPVMLRHGKPRNSGRPTLLFHQRTGSMRGGRLAGVPRAALVAMLSRYADWSRELVMTLLPDYRAALEQEFTTFRPCRRTSLQPLHMDAAIARPTQGRSMLRVFCNVNGAGVPRVWRVGGNFEPVARRFAPRLPPKAHDRFPGASRALQLLGVSKGPATQYDFTMRELRNLVVGDKQFQRNAGDEIVELPAGSTWLALTDLALHGAVSGQHSLDQTFLLDVSALRDPQRSSLRILEGLTGHALV